MSAAIPRLLFGVAALSGLLGVWWLLSSITTAQTRFGHCGPSSLDHPEIYCQMAMRLLYRAYAALAVAALLTVAGFVVKRRQGHARQIVDR
jgi:hypothetical protein